MIVSFVIPGYYLQLADVCKHGVGNNLPRSGFLIQLDLDHINVRARGMYEVSYKLVVSEV